MNKIFKFIQTAKIHERHKSEPKHLKGVHSEGNLKAQLSRLSTASFERQFGSLELIKSQEMEFINWVDDWGRTALHYACILKNTKLVKLLLDHGSLYYIKDKFGKDALHYSSSDEVIKSLVTAQKELFKTMIQKGDAMNDDESSPDANTMLQNYFDKVSSNFYMRDNNIHTAMPYNVTDLAKFEGEELFGKSFGFYDACAFEMVLRNWDGSGINSSLCLILL